MFSGRISVRENNEKQSRVFWGGVGGDLALGFAKRVAGWVGG